MGQALDFNQQIQKEKEEREYKKEKGRYKKYIQNLNKNNPVDRLEVLSKVRPSILGNRFYKGLKNQLDTNPNSAQQVSNALQRRLNDKYSGEKEGRRKARKEFLEKTIKLLRQQQNQTPQPAQTAGSKKRRRMQRVKGKRVLKNGTLAGYVKQADGSWRWRFLPK